MEMPKSIARNEILKNVLQVTELADADMETNMKNVRIDEYEQTETLDNDDDDGEADSSFSIEPIAAPAYITMPQALAIMKEMEVFHDLKFSKEVVKELIRITKVQSKEWKFSETWNVDEATLRAAETAMRYNPQHSWRQDLSRRLQRQTDLSSCCRVHL